MLSPPTPHPPKQHPKTAPYVFPLISTSTVRLSVHLAVVIMDATAPVQTDASPTLCSGEQCAFMCFMGLTADGDGKGG